MNTSIRKQAEKDSYQLVPKTCTEVDKALSLMEKEIKEQTGLLREALIDALERALIAEEKLYYLDQDNMELRSRE